MLSDVSDRRLVVSGGPGTDPALLFHPVVSSLQTIMCSKMHRGWASPASRRRRNTDIAVVRAETSLSLAAQNDRNGELK